MYLLGTAILLISLIPDIAMQFYLIGVPIKFQFCGMFLLYLAFRYPFRYLIFFLVLYCLLIYPFSGLSFSEIFFSYFLVLGIVYRLRSEIYTESYLVKAIWVFLFGSIHHVVINFLDLDMLAYNIIHEIFIEIIVNNFIMACLSVPAFMILDYFQDRFKPGSPQKADVYGMKARRGSNELL